MHMSAVLNVENISKEYRLGAIGHRYLFRDVQSAWARLRGKEDPNRRVLTANRVAQDNFLALDDVSFEVQAGEVLGVIGRNGAGKSTLLKILSRVTSPTLGQVKVKGRIASLLEVGTGFHPELSGRENIFLNGAILGMTKAEIRRQFDEIVDFSGVEKFVDTPVKRYSSGMYVRLAFAVAANLGADIMMIDEVLAVGDLEFQKKCIGKMESISRQSGRTILFVSHNMAAISALCNRVIHISAGKIQFDGPTRAGIDDYLTNSLRLTETPLADRRDRTGEGRMRFLSTWTEDEYGNPKDIFLSGESAVIAAKVEIEASLVGRKVSAAFQLRDPSDYAITDLNTKSLAVEFPINKPGIAVLRCTMPRLPLISGLYNHNVIVRADGTVQDFILTAGKFQVEEGNFFGTGKTFDKEHGTILFDQKWSFSELSQ
jgi:lipopolysaccharide transport system ATP-binding protein